MSEDVSKFLMQVKELGDRRIEEDEARSRELEERILRERKEREARRAERARSISPQKSSPVNTPPPSTRTRGFSGRLNLESSPILEPPSSPQSRSSLNLEDMPARGGSSPSKENESPFDSEYKPTGQTSPTRATRGLSWQKRPNSQASERSRSRPLSMVAAENAARNTPPEPASATEPISKEQISSALSGKDPSWFRQTADRGANSAAYRRNQVEDNRAADIALLPAAQLPGMSRAPSSEVSKDGTGSQPVTPAFPEGLASPLSLSNSQRLDPPSSDAQLETETDPERSHIRSPSLGRISPTKTDRPVSPTKGMGGFVQSAMMKRSDSIKRWSVQSPTVTQRTDPVISHRTGGYDASNRSSGGRSRPTSIIRDASTELPPRPSSSRDGELQGDDVVNTEKPSDSLRLETKPLPEPLEQELGSVTTPTSPSKTMDSRRWSPTKASWLESALKKPESPKLKSNPAPVSQPAWMAEIQKAKAEKASNPSAERSRSPTISHKHQVSIGGLMRSSAPGATTKPVGLSVLHSPSSSISTNIRPDQSSAPKDLQSPITPDAKSKDSETVQSPNPTVEAPSSMNKSKPETPPKKDFRANLKTRQAPLSSNTQDESELKNVFSKLRKTTTQNYVAPDELKSNILRGKAALNNTGGPQKTERVDELKEAILAKRKDFQKAQSEGRGVTRKDSTASEQPVPEGLAKRAELGRSNTITRDPITSDTTTTDPQRPAVMLKSDVKQEFSFDKSQRFSRIENRDPVLESMASRADRPIIPRRGSAQPVTTPKETEQFPSLPITPKDTSVPGNRPGKLGGSALANRFNPALAGLLARGPPGMAPASPAGGVSISNSQSNSAPEGNGNDTAPGPKLTHMTKSRARGPKRNAPTTTTSASTAALNQPENGPANTTLGGRSAAPIQPEEPPASVSGPQVIALVDSSKMEYGELINPKSQPISLIGSSKKSFESAPEEVSSKATNPPGKIHEQVAAFSAQRRQRSPTKVSDEPNETTSQPPSPRKLDMKRMSRFLDDSIQTAGKSGDSQLPKDTKKEIEAPPPEKPKLATDNTPDLDTSTLQSQPPPLSTPKRPLPNPVSSTTMRQPSKDSVQSNSTTSETPVTPLSGGRPLPPVPSATRSEISSSSRSLPKEPKQIPRPLPIPKSNTPPPTTSPVRSPVRSPTKQSHDTSALLGDFFGPERPRRKYTVDAAELLMHRPILVPTQIQTLSTQLFQFSADGKKQPIPSHHERTLFEREMYICSHTFKNEAGKKMTEVYFWAGDEIPRPTIEDASLFASREARALGGKLVKFQQGKERPEFLQALGGIIVVQRGSSNKYDSLAPRMLCGRRYYGHVVFDEVDFTPAALCSGFPYVVTTAGRCYIWKGKGSGVDELSCARLIGMDFALSGEMEEIEDGREPATFWDLFGVSSKAGSADHWRLKPNYDKYCCRLFCSDANSRQQIVEISPFSQADLLPTNIYVLDAFFELYIIVGSRAQPQYASFHNALDFAQEYAILAAGMEDRPFVPFSTVVLEGIPRDMKSVFRKWRDTKNPTITNVNAGLKRGRSLRVVPLNQALQALSD
ncbi:hypothetical protein AAE478_003748 [Parahypoxylon ruwenzoriense]